jgi:hypothetical protein
MHRLLASLLDSHRALSQRQLWRWLAGSGAHQPATTEPVIPACVVPITPQAAEPIPAPAAQPVAVTPRRLAVRMRTAPGDIRHAVISGPLSEVCALLEKLALDQESAESLAVTMH